MDKGTELLEGVLKVFEEMTPEEYMELYKKVLIRKYGLIPKPDRADSEGAQKNVLSDVLADDLKCCGNCLYRQSIDMGNDFSEKCEFGNHMESSAYCESWTWDNLLKSNRHD